MRKINADPFAVNVHVTLSRGVLQSIFDECDRYDHDETGGRILGTYTGNAQRTAITVTGVIEPGPKARRTPTSFFQDGEYQEAVFRKIEEEHPDIEHLGTWHTHHVNGYPTLSGGDRETYHRHVNHKNHNTDFWYALLVTARNGSGNLIERYTVRHFVFYRGDPNEYEIPASNVKVVDQPILWPQDTQRKESAPKSRPASAPAQHTERPSDQAENRVIDKDFFDKFHPGLRPFMSKETGKPYWRGPLALIDDSTVQVVVAEVGESAAKPYAIAIKAEPGSEQPNAYAEQKFASARDAIATLERHLNREIFSRGGKAPKRNRRFWRV